MTPIELLQRRIVEIKAERPTTREARIARDAAVHELENNVFALKIQAMNELLKAQRDAFAVLS